MSKGKLAGIGLVVLIIVFLQADGGLASTRTLTLEGLADQVSKLIQGQEEHDARIDALEKEVSRLTGTPTPRARATGQPLSVDHYVEFICWGEDDLPTDPAFSPFEDFEIEKSTWGETLAFLEVGLSYIADLSPPRELESWHHSRVNGMQTWISVLQEKDPKLPVNFLELAFNPLILAASEESEKAEAALPVDLRAVLIGAGCLGADEEPQATPTASAVDSYELGQPIAVSAGQLNEMYGEPDLQGTVTVTFKKVVTAEDVEDSICGNGIVEAEGVYIAIHYYVENEANSRVQPATQINSQFVLFDDKTRQWVGGGSGQECFLEANFAAKEGGKGPESWIGPGFSSETAIVFDVPEDATGLHLVSDQLRLEVRLEVQP